MDGACALRGHGRDREAVRKCVEGTATSLGGSARRQSTTAVRCWYSRCRQKDRARGGVRRGGFASGSEVRVRRGNDRRRTAGECRWMKSRVCTWRIEDMRGTAPAEIHIQLPRRPGTILILIFKFVLPYTQQAISLYTASQRTRADNEHISTTKVDSVQVVYKSHFIAISSSITIYCERKLLRILWLPYFNVQSRCLLLRNKVQNMVACLRGLYITPGSIKYDPFPWRDLQRGHTPLPALQK